MTNRARNLVAAAAVVAGLVTAVPAPATADTGAAPAPAPLKWTSCATDARPTLQCATVRAPLDHDHPDDRQVTLALTRVPHTAKAFQGPLLVNPGGPGGSGLNMAGFVATALPAKVAAQYDVIGFDPRGVGRSTPKLDCVPGYFRPVRPASVPSSAAAERTVRDRAASFAESCGSKYGDLLPYMDTVSAAHDLDTIREALGARRINYLGYSYGTYLGAVYAQLHPDRVRRFVLDSVVDPEGVWYADNIAQDYAFDARHKAFAAWVAKNDAAYRLGTDPDAVEAAWYRMRAAVAEKPAGGKVGPGELEDTFLPGGYYNGYWPALAEAFASYVNDADGTALLAAWERFGETGDDSNGYSVYTAVQCRDADWPRDWSTWRNDARDVASKAPFITWNNAWYNAPCASWPVEPLSPVRISNDAVPPMLLFQATEDAATPYAGGLSMHRSIKGSRLVVEEGGGNHGITLSGNTCLDTYLSEYLGTGAVPTGTGRGDADAVCTARPDPEPRPAGKAPRAKDSAKDGKTASGSGGGTLHGLLGFRG